MIWWTKKATIFFIGMILLFSSGGINSVFAENEIDCSKMKENTQEFLDKYVGIRGEMESTLQRDRENFTTIAAMSVLLKIQAQREKSWGACYSKDATEDQKKLFEKTTKEMHAMGKEVSDSLKKQ